LLIDKNLDNFATICRQAGLKITPQRKLIYRCLLQSKEHPSAEMLLKTVRNHEPSISLDTVSRTLKTFESLGLVKVMAGGGDARRFDGDTSTHQHFRCVNCHKIFDFHYKPYESIEIPSVITDRFKILGVSVYVEGYCPDCQ